MMIKKRLARGNALVETSLLMLVMLPLIFATAMMGDLIDIKQNMEQASRYASWESTVDSDPSVAASSARVQERFFSAADAPIFSGSREKTVNTLWGESHHSMGQLQSESAVVLDQDSVAVRYADAIVAPTMAMKVNQAAARSGEILDGIKGNTWGLSSSGPSSMSVTAKIKSSEWLPGFVSSCPESSAHVCVSSRGVILGDGWSASSDLQAAQRVRSLMPASALEPIGNAVSVIGNLPVFQELKDLRGAFGHVDMSVLPEYIDR